MSAPGPRFERSVAFWLRAYPRRWRAVRGAEVQALAADLAAPGATRLDARSAAGLVVGGWATRWRTRPPWRVYLLYSGFERRIPPRYRAWAADDLEGRFYGLRLALRGPGAAILAMVLTQRILRGGANWAFVGLFAALSAVLWLTIGRWRVEQSRRRHLVPQYGEAVVDGSRGYDWAPRERVSARAGTATTLVVAAVLAPTAVVAWLTAPRRFATVACDYGDGCFETTSLARQGAVGPVVGGLLVALVVGGAAAWLASWRLHRLVRVRPFQPARQVVGLGLRRAAATIVGVGLALADLAAEAAGRIDLWAATAVALVAVALLPACAVTWRFAARGPANLAWSDVRRIVWTGRLPAVDQHVTALVPVVVARSAAAAGEAVPQAGAPSADTAEGLRPDWLH